jgi:hypothetical protein
MADINVQKKKRPIWPWILGLALAIAGMWAILAILDREVGTDHVNTATRLRGDQPGRPGTVSAYDDADADNEATTGNGHALAPNTPETGTAATGITDDEINRRVNAFTEYVSTNEAEPEYEYASNGIQYMADALDAYTERHFSNDQTVEGLRQRLHRQAGEIKQSSGTVRQSDVVRDAFTTGAAMITTIHQNQNNAGLESKISDVRRSAESIDPGRTLQEQQTEIKQYFTHASEALQAMTTATTATSRR